VSELETIELLALSAITGGGNSTSWIQMTEHLPSKGGFRNITKSSSSQMSDYDTCVKAVGDMAGATAGDISAACGTPRVSAASTSTSTRL
jgi:hypothetical protein